MQVQAGEGVLDNRGPGFGQGGGFVLVGNAEAAAAIDRVDRQALGTQLAHQRGEFAVGGAVGGHGENLAADVDGQAAQGDAR